jgi:AcrR family transcriptional regulator
MTATTPRKRGRPPDATARERRREEILDAAARVFARLGYQYTDVQFVADALGLGKGTIYRYFASKEELFLAAADRGMQRLAEAVYAVTESVPDPLDGLAAGIRAYLTFFRDHPEYTELIVQERAAFKDRKQPTYFVHRDANCGVWEDRFAALIAGGRVRPMPVAQILDVLGDLVYGTMFTNHFVGRHKPLDGQAREILDVLFHGILTDAERRRRRPGERAGGRNGNG